MTRRERHPAKRWIVVVAALAAIAFVIIAMFRWNDTPPPPPPPPPTTTTAPKPPTHRSFATTAPVEEGGLVVTVHDKVGAPGEAAEVRDALVEVCTTFATTFSLGTPSRELCTKRAAGDDEARAECRERFTEAEPVLEMAVSEGRVKANFDALRACAVSIKACDERKALVGQVPQGQPCDDSVECAPPLICGAPDVARQEFRCIAKGTAGDGCASFLRPCADGLDCNDDGVCVVPATKNRGGAGARCGDDDECVDGFVCTGRRCRAAGVAGERCEAHPGLFGGRVAGSCAPGLWCIDGACNAPVESGARCEPPPASTTTWSGVHRGDNACAADCEVCRPVLAGQPPVCAPRGDDGERCADDDDCLSGLACVVEAGVGSCKPEPPPPQVGERCVRPRGCAAGDDDCVKCAPGLHCAKGRCATGAAGAACDDATDCDNASCESGTCVALPTSGPCNGGATGVCADGYECKDGACAARRLFGEACGAETTSCKPDNVCLDGRCLPRRWGGEKCDADDDCQSLKCLPDVHVCMASHP